MSAWTDGGFSKLRYVEDGFEAFRLFGEYHGRITPTLRARVVVDYVDDASGGLDLTEAVIDWRPIPRSRNQHQLRFGAFYPSFSLENGDRGWQSPFTYSYSAINTWIGEEIRPFGAEWSLRRRFEGLPQQPRSARVRGRVLRQRSGRHAALLARLVAARSADAVERRARDSAAAVHDEAATAFAVHGDSIIVPARTAASSGVMRAVRSCSSRATTIARIRIRSRTASGVGAPISIISPCRSACPRISASSCSGWTARTEWLTAALPNGTRLPMSEYAQDRFESQFVMLTRTLGANQRLAVRYDTFSTERPAAMPVLHSDAGHAWTLSYRIDATERFSGGIEWLRIDSQRDLWPMFYATPRAHTEDQLRVQFSYRLAAPRARMTPPQRGRFRRQPPALREVGRVEMAATLEQPGRDGVAHEQRQLVRADRGLAVDGGPGRTPSRVRRDGERQRLVGRDFDSRLARDVHARVGAVAGHRDANAGDAEEAAPAVDELRELIREHAFELRARQRHANHAVVEGKGVVGVAERQRAARQVGAQPATARPVAERRVGARQRGAQARRRTGGRAAIRAPRGRRARLATTPERLGAQARARALAPARSRPPLRRSA